MAGERLFDLAVTALAAQIRSGIAAQLRAVETAQSLTSGSIPDVAEVLEANAPNDQRSPLIEVFDTSAECTDHRDGLWAVQCGVAVSVIADADVSTGERLMRRYATAVVSAIRSDVSLGSRVIAADVGTYTSEVFRGPSSATRYVFTIGVVVHLNDA